MCTIKIKIFFIRFLDFLETSLKNLFRTFIAYSSMLINKTIFYLSNGNKESSEIIYSLIINNKKTNISYEGIKQFLISESQKDIFQLLISFPYYNFIHLERIYKFLLEKKLKITELIKMNSEQINMFSSVIFKDEKQIQEFNFRCMNHFMNICKILNKIK